MNLKVRNLYKTLLYMGKEYPQELGGYPKFQKSLKQAFMNTKINDETELNNALDKGNYIIKELETLYYLKRYRYLKRKYLDQE